MAKPLLLSIGNGKVQELVGTANNDIPTWNSTTSEWVSTSGGGGGSGTVTSVGLTGGTSGIVIGGTTSPITTSGTYNLDAPLRFAFNTTTPTAVAAAGQVSWNDTEGSLASMLKGNSVTALLGQQVYQRATNVDTDPLTKGMVVYVFGSSGTRISVKRALADADLSSAAILGVVAEEIAVNGTGFIMTSGLIKDLSVLKPADGFDDGIVVYLSPTTAGALTATKPEAPNHLVTVGYVAKASAGEAGELLVHTQNGYELGELHDVYVNSPTSGQILIYDATTGQTRWENASLTGGTGVTVTSGPGSLSVAIGQAVATSASPTFAGLTLTGKLVTPASTVTTAGLNLPHGTAPTSPVDGDMWTTTSSVFARINGTTQTLAALSGINTWTGANTFASTTNSFGTGTGTGTIGLASGATTFGNTKTINIGTSGLSGSTTTITIGATVGASTTTLNGTVSLANALAVGSGGTNNASLSVAQGTVYYGDGTKLVGLAPGTSGQFLQTQGAGANPQWAAAGGGGSTPYDVSGEFVGTPVASAVIMRFVAVRPFTLSDAVVARFNCTSNTGATTAVFTVNVEGASKGTVSIASNGTSGTGTLTSTSVLAGNVITVVATTPANIINVWFTLPGTV